MNSLHKHFFWKYAYRKNNLFDKQEVEKTNRAIIFSLRCFYVLLLCWSYTHVLEFRPSVEQSTPIPLWPVFWVRYMSTLPWGTLFTGALFITLLGTQFYYKKRLIRVIVFCLLFVVIALYNSTGKISHNLHALLIPTFYFTFLDLENIQKIKGNLLWFASAIFSLLILYFLTGFWKIARGFKQLLVGEISVFNISAMSNHLNYQFRHSTMNPIAAYLVENEYLGFMFLWVGILIEFTPLFFFFKSKSHPIAGILFILLHVGIMWVMQVGFFESVITIIPLLVLSPFYRNNQMQ